MRSAILDIIILSFKSKELYLVKDWILYWAVWEKVIFNLIEPAYSRKFS